MRRVAPMLVATGVVGLVLAGCGGSGNSLAGPTNPPSTTAPPPTVPETTAPPTVLGTTTPPPTVPPPTAPPTTGPAPYNYFLRDFVGSWTGSVGKAADGTDYILELSFPQSPDTAPGQARIKALGCTGSVPYRQAQPDGRYVFGLVWEPGKCASGTIWLTPLGPTTVAYHWEDGQGHVSDTTLTRS